MKHITAVFFSALIFSGLIVQGESTYWSWFGKGKSHMTDQNNGKMRSKVEHRAVYDAQSIAVITEKGGLRGKELLDQLQKEYSLQQQSCWAQAYAEMEGTCTQMLASEDVKSRFALKLSHCFLSSAGRRTKPCPEHRETRECTARLDPEGLDSYRAFYIDSTAACHILQSGAFRHETERVINALKGSAEWVEDQLTLVAQKSDAIFSTSSRSLALHQQLQDNLDIVRHSLTDVADEQELLAQEQKALAGISSAIARNLSQGHARLFQGQRKAVDGLTRLETQQQAAFESMRLLTEFAKSHHREMMTFQGDMATVQDRLLEGSNSLMNAQESFAGKLQEMFAMLDRLFEMYNRMVIESRLASSLLFSILSSALVYLLTSTNRTAAARLPIFFVLVMNFIAEIFMARSQVFRGQPDMESVIIARMRNASGILALAILVYCCCTFRDYAAMNFQILQSHEQQLKDIRRCLHQWLAPEGMPTIVPIYEQEQVEASDEGPLFLNYIDPLGSADSDSDDPDYCPSPTAIKSLSCGSNNSSYWLRPGLRSKKRRMAASATMLAWETSEDFIRLVFVNSAPSSSSAGNQNDESDSTNQCLISDGESKEVQS